MKSLIAVTVLTISQFTAFPFLAIVAANTARHSEARSVDPANMTVVYKTEDGRRFETM
ncbi:hypothetical protein [Aestuariivirga litoralis]|uniref:hypothetical protein n=1 Tax=Aestuariivirga litoralis TaxID=2650924 RepID=UPI00137A203D|nr:hypothetical protein [Aestuariivirga litoralis]